MLDSIDGYTTNGVCMKLSIRNDVAMSEVVFERDRRRWREHASYALRGCCLPDSQMFVEGSSLDSSKVLRTLIEITFNDATYAGKHDPELFDRMWERFSIGVAQVDAEFGTDYFGSMFEGKFATIPQCPRPDLQRLGLTDAALS